MIDHHHREVVASNWNSAAMKPSWNLSIAFGLSASIIAFLLGASLLLLAASLRAADPHEPYRTHYRVIDVHRHCTPVGDDVVRAEFEVLDQVGVTAFVMLDATG